MAHSKVVHRCQLLGQQSIKRNLQEDKTPSNKRASSLRGLSPNQWRKRRLKDFKKLAPLGLLKNRGDFVLWNDLISNFAGKHESNSTVPFTSAELLTIINELSDKFAVIYIPTAITSPTSSNHWRTSQYLSLMQSIEFSSQAQKTVTSTSCANCIQASTLNQNSSEYSSVPI